MSALPQESFHHFHQFSGVHGVPWCWTHDMPVDLCPVPRLVGTDSTEWFARGAGR
jgi:hypothetical protein